MLVAEKYRLQREIGWSDEAEVHSGPLDPARNIPIAVKIRHGMGGPPRPNGNRERFLRATADQQAAVDAGCRQVAPIFEMGHEGDNAFYVTRHYPRSLDSLIEGRVTLEAPILQKIAAGVLQALEELRDRHARAHGNIKATNIFLDGKTAATSTVVFSDLAFPEDAGTSAEDCYALGTVLFQLVRGRVIRHFDWPIEPGPDWSRLGPTGNSWREFCNELMSPRMAGLGGEALKEARDAFKNMRRLHGGGHAAAAGGGGQGSRVEAPPRRSKGLLVGAGILLAAVAAIGVVLLQPAGSKLGQEFRSFPVLAGLFRLTGARQSADALPPSSSPEPTLAVAQGSPTPPQQGIEDSPTPTAAPVMVVEATPPPTPAPTPPPAPTANPGDKWIGYTALLQQFQTELDNPAAAEQPEILNTGLSRLRDSIGFLPVKGEPTVDAFLKALPAKLEATGDQPDLPDNLWTKEGSTRQDDVQGVTYQWGHSGVRFVFNRVNVPGRNGPAFYLAATAVPMAFGGVLAKMAEADGKGPLSGAASVRGPVSWEYVRGTYAPRASWMVLDNINAGFYANAGRPVYDSPMNGLSAIDAVRLARAAGCLLPTLAQWDAVLASPSGEQWVAQWQTAAKVRSPQWSAFAKGIQAQHVTGAKLPNDQCFGDHADLSAVTETAGQSLFFEPVSSRMLKGFAHLIGNVGQYVVDDARTPTKYYFAGGSAEAAPSAFASLTAPLVVVSPFLTPADAGMRLAAPAKGNGSEKNPAFDKLKTDLVAELARVQRLQ